MYEEGEEWEEKKEMRMPFSVYILSDPSWNSRIELQFIIFLIYVSSQKFLEYEPFQSSNIPSSQVPARL